MNNNNIQQKYINPINLFDLIKNGMNQNSNLSLGDIDKIISVLKEQRDSLDKKKQDILEKQKIDEELRQEQKHIEEVTSMDLPMDWDNVFNSDERAQGIHADSIPDGLILSLANLGRVDIEYISAITGEDYKTVINTLKGSIYQNPEKWDECFFKGWETAEEYLSGNLIRKWQIADEANTKYHGYFKDNLDALKRVIPKSISSKDIYITLGSPWIPADIIDDFMMHLFGDPLKYCTGQWKEQLLKQYQTKHDPITGSWEIPEKSRYNHSVAVRKTYGTTEMEALHILEKTLNMKTVSVSEEIPCLSNKSGKKKIINQTETVAVIEKQKKLIEEFQKWVWTDAKRKERLEAIYTEKYGCNRRRLFDGSFLTFPGLSPSVHLFDYQKNAVARIIFTPNTLLAHDVGAGKTYIMIAAGQELKRMGLSKKNMYVVPNNIVGQWKNIYLSMYPNANILCIEPKTFKPEKRADVLKDIKEKDYDGIIIAYSCFELIPLSKNYYTEQIEEEIKKIDEALKKKGSNTYRLKNKKEALKKELNELQMAIQILPNNFICFDDLNVTRLFVDEAHNFKNVKLDTKANMVLGISSDGSKKCQDMLDKVYYVQKHNDGKGVVLATGTPITNSITDAFIMQKYLQSGDLALLDLDNFDSWIGMFAERATNFEIDVDTNSYRLATRFSKFHNLPELTALLANIADFHQLDETANIPECEGRIDCLISKSPALADYLEDISQRADDVRKGRVDRNTDNMLKITTDGRKAALDLRLVDENAQFSYRSKVARCAENVADIYFKTFENKNTQLIFCDTSTPKQGFNIYDELKNLLMQQGIPANKIAFIHDANTESQRTALFKKVNSGEIRILIGSTFKLGLGVNVQERLIALHHIDVPWRPADMTQREGRILRQGNTCDKIYIYRYVTEGSFDAYSWQLLETKQQFINALLAGSLTQRSGSDIEDTVLDYAEVKALAIGNPLIKKRVEVANELTKYKTLQSKLVETKTSLEEELLELPGRIKNMQKRIVKVKEDADYYKEWQKLNQKAEDTEGKKVEAANRKYLREFVSNALKNNILRSEERKLISYRGFDVILPANMIQEKPYVYLQRTARYYLELGDTEIGNLVRIDNFLETLDGYLEEQKSNLQKLKEKENDINKELSKDENYYDVIEKLRIELEKIDNKLGVKK